MLTKSNDITPENEEVDWVEIPDLSSTEEEEVDWQPSGEEQQFQEWYQNWSEKTGINPDPDDPRHKYDYRAAHEAGAEPIISAEDNKYHWPSEFKADDHPNRFVDGKDTKYQGGGQAQAQEPVEDPDDIWSDSSFTGEKPIDEGPSMWQKIVPGLASGMGGPFIEPILYAATGTEPYRAPDADPGAFEPRKGMTEGWKSLVKSGSRALQMITAHEADLPDVAGYNLEDPISRSSYYLALLKSKAFNETNEIVEPIFSKLTELEQLQPDLDYYSRLENKSTFVKYAEEVVGMAPQIATQVAAHAVGGGIGSGIWMALQIAGSEYDSLIRDGADPERAEAAAWASALMQAPIEALSLGFMLNNPITRKFVKGGIVKFGLDRIIGGATEFITETVQKVPSKFWENWAQDPEYLDKLRENPEMLQALVAQGLKEGMKEGWVAAFYGAILGGAGSAKPTSKGKGLNIPEGTQKILNTLANEVSAGTRTTEDIETMRKGMDPSHPLYDALGGLLEVSTPGETSGAESAAKDGLEAGERLTRLEEITIGALKQDGNYKEGETLEAVRVVESKKKRVNDAVKIFKAIGLDAIVYRGKGKIDGFNGMMDTETGQIYLNETAKDPYITVLAHESAHRLKKDHPDLYNKLEKTLKGMMTAGDLDITEYLAETNKNRLAAGVPKLTLEDALSTEEFIADLVGHQFGEKPFWNKLHKANPTLGKQLAQIVNDLLDAIKSAMRKNKSVDAKVFRDLNNMQDAIADTYAEFARREAKVKPVKKPMTAAEKAAVAADMPVQVEFDHIVKGLNTDQRAAAEELIADTEAPIRERLAKLKDIIKPKPAKKDIGDLTNEEIAKMDPEARAKAVLGPEASAEDIEAMVKQITEFEAAQAPQKEFDSLVSGLTPAQLKDKAIKNVIDDKTSAVSQRTGQLKNAIAAYNKKNPPKVKKAKESKKGLNVRTLRGAILAAGGIKWGDQFKGERKTMAENNPGAMYLTRQKTGMPWDTLEQQLKADGWLGPEEVLLDVLNDPSVLKRGRVTGDLMDKKTDHLTAQEKEAKAEIIHEAEEPPPGDYQVMTAEDLPVGKKLTLIENESTRGWDVYEVIEKDPFGVTLKDGVTIELSPSDKVQVRKADIAASVKKLELTGEKAMGAKEAELKAKRRTRSAGRQETLGLIEPAPKGDWFKGEKATPKEAKAMKKGEVKGAVKKGATKVHWAEEIKGNRQNAIEYMYRNTYEASKQYPTTAYKDLVAVHVWDKPGEGNKILNIRYATRKNVDAIENKTRDDYPDAWVTRDSDLSPYQPKKGEISYKKYAIERDKGIERPNMMKPTRPEQGRLPGFSVKRFGMDSTTFAIMRGGRTVADLIDEAEILSKKVDAAYEAGDKNAEDLDVKLDVVFEKLDSRLSEIEEEEETFDDEADVMADIGNRYYSMAIDKNSLYYTESDKEIADTIRSVFGEYGPNKSNELTDAEVIGIAEDAYLFQTEATTNKQQAKFKVKEGIHYHSGLTRSINDIKGAIDAGEPVSVDLPRLAKTHLKPIIEYANSGGKVLIDSGAFTVLTKGKEINYDSVVEKYQQMIDATDGKVSVIAPDVIGNQDATYDLLKKYADTISKWIDKGADVIIPIQKGNMSPHEYWQEVVEILGSSDIRVGIPSNKAAFSTNDINDLFDVSKKSMPRKVHFLGIGPGAKEYRSKIEAIRKASAFIDLSTDATTTRTKKGQIAKKTDEYQEDLVEANFDVTEDIDWTGVSPEDDIAYWEAIKKGIVKTIRPEARQQAVAEQLSREQEKAKKIFEGKPPQQAEFSVKSYGEMDKGDKAAYNKQTKVMPNGDEVRKRINANKGSAWAGTAIRSILTRQSFDDIIAGKPVTYDSPINEKKAAAFKRRLEKGGKSAMWDYLMKRSFLGEAKKPIHCISGSFAECNPSKNCVDVCYAATGRRQASVFLKAESVNWGVETDPKRAASMAATQYLAVMDSEVHKALRMFDRGEAGSENWTTFINGLNDNGIRTQIFSKRPEFIRSVSDINLKLLSVDSSNTALADANPDLALAMIYEGDHDLDMLEKYKNRFETYGGVILPVIYTKQSGKQSLMPEGWTEADIAKLPAWAKNYTCPIDAGTKRVMSDKPVSEEEAKKPVWNCTKCDSANGLPGCFYGKSTAKVLAKLPERLTMDEIQYRVEDLKKHGEGIKNGRIRKQFYEDLDLFISEIRGGRDPGAAETLESEVFRDRERKRESVSARRGTGKGQIKDEDIEVSDTKKVKFSPKFKKPGQLELPIFSQQQLEKPAKKPATKSKGKVVRKAKPKAVKSDQKLQDQIQKTRMATTGWIASAGRVVRNVDEAASLASFIRKGAQEVTYAILTDKNGLVLEIQRHSKGMIASAPVDGPPLIANTLRTEGAKHIYFVHNHPSMNTDPSPEDANMTQYLKNMASAFDIDVHSFVIGGTSYLDIDTGKQQKITPVLRTVKLPVKERMLNKLAGFDKNPTVGNSNDARAYLQNVHKNAEGFLFMNSNLKPVGFLPYSAPTTMKAQTEEFLKAAEEVNASGFVFNSTKSIDTTPGRAKFLQTFTRQLGGRYQLFEIMENGVSFADSGKLSQYKMSDQGVQPKLGELGTKTPLMSVKKAPGFYSQMERTLESKLQNKGTVDQFKQTIDALVKKGEFKAEELEWSGLPEYFDEQVHPDLETFRALRGWELTKDLPGRLNADQEAKYLKQINAEYDALIKKPLKIKKEHIISWLRANALQVEEVQYRDRQMGKQGYVNWPQDAGDEYSATWKNPVTSIKHKFSIEKVAGPVWDLKLDGEVVSSELTEEDAQAGASDLADDMFQQSIVEASKVEWVPQEQDVFGKKLEVPTWRANEQDPTTGEYITWTIERRETDWEVRPQTNYVIYQDGELWDDTAGHSLAEAQRFVETQIEDALRDSIDIDFYGTDYLPDEEGTHHESWTMPGGQNYQELLLKLPSPTSAERLKLIKDFEKKYGGVYGQDFQYRDLEVSEQEAITVAARAADQAIRDKGVFRHSHWDEDNVIAHTRFNDRIDDKGRKVLFLEEVQSDWHQTGREQGYGNKVFTKEDLDISGNSIALKGTGHAVSNAKDIPIEEKIESALKYFNKYIKIPAGVPDAPFKKSWPLLVMKRMVRWAAKEGYDTVSWTPGMVQINRYEEAFRKQVDKISWYVSPSKNIKVVNASKGGNQVGVFELDEKGIAIQAFPADAKGLHISKIIGKKMGSQAMEEKEGKVTGDDLSIGGEGMKAFYDKRLVNDVNNFFGKKIWGNAHVEIAGTVTGKEIGEEISIDVLNRAVNEAQEAKDPVAVSWLREQAQKFLDTGQYSMALFNPNPYPGADKPPSFYFDKARKFEDKYQRIWTLPITTEMREKSLEEGMPLFSVKKALRIPDMTDPSIKDYRVNFSAKDEDHAGHAAAKIFNAGHGDHIVKFDGEWDRSAVDMDPMYQFTLYEGPATGATFVTETLDAEEIDAKFTTIVTPFLENKAVLSAKDRIDPVLQTYIDALKAAQPDAFIASEDLTEDPDNDLPPEVAADLEASKGLGRRSFGQWLRETSKDIWHSSTRHRPYLDPKEYADVANILRIHQEVPTNSARRAGQVLSAIMGNLKPMQYKVFARKLLMDDMAKDVESGLLADPNNLPFGFNIKTARAYLAKLNAIVDKDPIIKDAIERRTAFNNKIKRALVDAKLLPKAVMEDERYFHHQVLQYRAVREMGSDYYPGIGVSSKDVRLKKKGWQRGRIGSDKSYNSDYAEAEFEVIAQAIAQLETKHTMGRLQDLIDTMPALKTRAKSMNLRQLFINEAARVTKADMSGKIWTPVMIQEEPGMNPLRPFSAEIGKGFSWIGNLAKKGKLENGTRDFTDVIEALEEWQRDVADEKARAKDDGRDPYPIPFPFDELGSRAWAYFNHMMKENLEGAPAAGIIFRAIRQRDAFIKEYLGAQFKTAKDIMPDDHTVWVPAPGTSWYKAHSLSDRIVDAVQAGEMVIGQENADKIKQVLARGRDIEWIIPTDIAKTLDGYDVKLEDHMLSKASRKLMTSWKQWILINPYRVIKYNLNNMSGDLDIALAYDPKIVFKYFGKATKDMYKDWKRKDMSPELQAEIDLAHALGVIGSGWSVQEVGDVTRELSYDRHMQAVTGEKPHLIERGWRGLQGFTNYRENILRLAAFRYFQDRLAAGEKNIYGASNKAEIDGIADNTEKAAKLARELIGDYGNITHSGQWLRRHMIPFYAWMEVNAPRYVRLMRNLRHEGGGAKKIGRALPLLSAKMGWRGTKLAVKASAIYVLVNLWNKLRYPDEEEELGESQRRQLHIIFGRREDGSIITLRFQGALSDALAWFGGEDITHDIADLIKGKVSPAEYAKETFLAPAIKVINAIRPDVKVGAEVLMGRSLYPDPFNPRPIYDKLEHVTRLFSLNTAYGWLAGKPKRGDTIGGMLLNDLMVLGFYNSDPGESAYYDIKSKTFDFLNKTGMERPSVTPTDKGVALYYYKQALKYGDLKAAEKYLGKYIKLGGKSTGVTQSLKRSAPLGSLAKKDHNKFLATLNENEKERYRLALQWYNDTYIRRRNQATIRPTPGTSGLDSVIDGSQTGGKTLREVLNQKNQ